MRFSVFVFLMFFLVLLMLIQPVQAEVYDFQSNDAMACTYATQKMEKVYQIKRHLLTTIANVETGRWNPETKQKTAWPWTVNAQGKGMFFDSKDDAVRAVKRLQAKGVKSIDVGCMQINLVYHPDAFDSVEDAFDPQKNAQYAAKFLKNLYENNDKDWIKAAMAYHSKVPTKAQRYKKKIVSTYEAVKQAQLNFERKMFGLHQEKVKADTNKKEVALNQPKPAEKKIINSASQWREAKLMQWRSRNN